MSVDSRYYPGLYQSPLALDEYRIITLENTPQHDIGLNPYVLFDNRDIFINYLELFGPSSTQPFYTTPSYANSVPMTSTGKFHRPGLNYGVRYDYTKIPITPDYSCNACNKPEPERNDYQNPYKINKLSLEQLYGERPQPKSVVPKLNCYQRQNSNNILMKPNFCTYQADGSIQCANTSPYCRQNFYQMP